MDFVGWGLSKWNKEKWSVRKWEIQNGQGSAAHKLQKQHGKGP